MDATPHSPSLLVMAVFGNCEDAFAWARETVTAAWGPLALSSDVLPFDQTTYYESSMGSGLKKQLWAFEELLDPAELPDRKLQTNQWEHELTQQRSWDVERPINLDPGYLTEAKLVLATTKDRDHRIYLRDGIYAEGTIFFHKGRWQNRPWTYPDFQTEAYHAFFLQCRNWLRSRRS